ncbi:MAG: hypothetical protein AVDCRST_MAG49-2364 [uncultured Thermomicrobiales bacterium]|uniref:ABC transmembrane type-1 domain-containing protein n=1 Tax=uncultured Thermomicrobiales bacterium TaxID=1645740 RepID=A0A6J4USR2_9BACT|nr:MAG: hypothetical protein AVDCRST_MAG49-2364 [uncultured Thermomicrobiales bacterium]
MAFFMNGLDPEGYDRTYDDRVLVRRVLAYFRPFRWAMIGVAAMVAIAASLEVALPLLVARGIDRLADDRSGARVGWLAAGILGAGVLAWAFSFVR